MPLLALERLIDVRRKTSLFGCSQGKQFVLFKVTLERVCETQTRVNYHLSWADNLHVYSFFLCWFFQRLCELWASPLELLLTWLLRFLWRTTTWLFFLHCDVAFLQPDELEDIWRWPAETRAEAQVSRHILLLKSALKNQPKQLAKDHPWYLWQGQLKSALPCSKPVP